MIKLHGGPADGHIEPDQGCPRMHVRAVWEGYWSDCVYEQFTPTDYKFVKAVRLQFWRARRHP